MTLPTDRDWERVEEIAQELQQLASEAAANRLRELQEAGEPVHILTLVSIWLSLPSPVPPISSGDVVDSRYTLVSKLADGGMGSVWLATQNSVGREVAVKFIPPSLVSPALIKCFGDEVKILGQLNHPGIVKIFDAGLFARGEAQVPFFVMEYVQGEPLAQWASTHRTDRRKLAELFCEVCEALQHAHDRKIVHRDLKPGNIIVREDGRVVVLDFGISRIAGADSPEIHEVFSGTPQYSAPEQHLGKDRDFRSGESVDVFAAGAVFFEMLAGRRLFQFAPDATIAEMRRTIIEVPPPRLAEVMPDCPPLLDEIVARAVRRDPADRYYTISAMGLALRQAIPILWEGRVAEPRPWSPAQNALVLGTSWRLARLMGRGAAGEVWLGVHEELGEQRVFKFCDSEEKARSLRREMTLYRLLKQRIGSNPHFVRLHDVALEAPPRYLMMDCVDALDLGAWCAAQPGGLGAVPLGARIEIVAQTAEALQAAHEAGILHRDIKPANLLIGKTNEHGASLDHLHVYVADFGIGQIVAEDLEQQGTMGGFTMTLSEERRSALAGTVLYLAPEVTEGGAASAKSDLYSLGVVFWQLLKGDLHAALNVTDGLAGITDSLLREDLMRCLAHTAEQRWLSAGEFAASLRALPERRVRDANRQAEIAARERAAYRRGIARSALVGLAVLLVITVLGMVAFSQWQSTRRAWAKSSLEQAAAIPLLDFKAGRRERAFGLLEQAWQFPSSKPELRSAALAAFCLDDLLPAALPPPPGAAPFSLPVGATALATSENLELIAVGRAVDQFCGAIEFVDSAGKLLRKFDQGDRFPSMPVPEMLTFSPDHRLLAIAGPRTSSQILLYRPRDSRLDSYIYHGAGLTCLAWHPAGRLLVTGTDDHRLLFWDRRTAMAPKKDGGQGTDFDLPPALTEAAIDTASVALNEHRGNVLAVAFEHSGRWLASLDSAGWLYLWSGYGEGFLKGLPPDGAARPGPVQGITPPLRTLELKVEISGATALSIDGRRIVLRDATRSLAAYEYTPGPVLSEAFIGVGAREVAWSHDARVLCVISASDVFWLEGDSLRIMARDLGKFPTSVAWDESTGRWALPAGDKFIERWPLPNGRTGNSPPWTLSNPEQTSGESSMAASMTGRLALYHQRRIQFVYQGKSLPQSSEIAVPGDGDFREMVWDRQGRLLSAVHLQNGHFHIQSWETTQPISQPRGSFQVRPQILVSAEDGVHLFGRSVEQGLLRIHAATGQFTVLDESNAARQDSPVAVSSRGEWIAAVHDQSSIRLLTSSGQWYGTITMPRPCEFLCLAWDPSGERLAALTVDGYLYSWNLTPWRSWLEQRKLLLP